jgi:hypothetical protein
VHSKIYKFRKAKTANNLGRREYIVAESKMADSKDASCKETVMSALLYKASQQQNYQQTCRLARELISLQGNHKNIV